jgi:hypothetical protein
MESKMGKVSYFTLPIFIETHAI